MILTTKEKQRNKKYPVLEHEDRIIIHEIVYEIQFINKGHWILKELK